MKITSEAIIQNRNISRYSEDVFEATYKGRDIYITTDHVYGKPKYDHLRRYDIVVTINGSYEVNTYEDFHTMQDAIRYALKGACLIK